MRIAPIALTLTLVTTSLTHAAKIEWSAADRAEIAKRAKKADKFKDGVRVRAASWTVMTPFSAEFTAELSLWFDRATELHAAVFPGKPQVTQPTDVTIYTDRAKFAAAGGEAGRTSKLTSNLDFSTSGKGSLHSFAVIVLVDPKQDPSVADVVSGDLLGTISNTLTRRLIGSAEYPLWMTFGFMTFMQMADWSKSVAENVDRIVTTLRTRKANSLSNADDVATVRRMLAVDSSATAADAGLASGFLAFGLRDRAGRKFIDECTECAAKTKKFEPSERELKAIAKAWFAFTSAEAPPK